MENWETGQKENRISIVSYLDSYDRYMLTLERIVKELQGQVSFTISRLF